jgi:hypothetical protein
MKIKITVNVNPETKLTQKLKKAFEEIESPDDLEVIIEYEAKGMDLVELTIITDKFLNKIESDRQDEGWTFLEKNLPKEILNNISTIKTVVRSEYI